jgi:hypothetical protein
MSKKSAREVQVPPAPGGAWESRAFFAALLAACRGDDKKAGDILRALAERMSQEFAEVEKPVG